MDIDTNLKSQLSIGMAQLGLQVPDQSIDLLLQYIELLSRWNQTYNLTAIKDLKDMVPLHLLDSLSISTYLQGDSVLDVGTGAGLPGIPLAIVHPEKHFVLVDSNSKKTRFVTQAIAELGLKNIEVKQSRLDAFQPKRPIDCVTARAFAALSDILVPVSDFCPTGARLLAMKGHIPEAEIQNLGLSEERLTVYPLQIPFVNAERNLIEIRIEHREFSHG